MSFKENCRGTGFSGPKVPKTSSARALPCQGTLLAAAEAPLPRQLRKLGSLLADPPNPIVFFTAVPL